MAANQPHWPRQWLMTDERIGERLWEAIDALPSGAGVVFRHHATPPDKRARLAHRVAETCQERGVMLAVARDSQLARALGAQLVHNPADGPEDLLFSRSAHSIKEAEDACDEGASLIFLSPIFRTRSHPGMGPLSRQEAQRIVATCPVPVIALGGVTRGLFAEIERDGFYGWAGIDAWLPARPDPPEERDRGLG